MIVEDRFGSIDGLGVDNEMAGLFALFGRVQISAAEAMTDGVNLFAARVAALDDAMQSNHESLLLKQDLVEHVNNLI